MAGPHPVDVSAFPRPVLPVREPGGFIRSGPDGLSDFLAAVNEAWAYIAPILVQDIFTQDELALTSSNSHSRVYRFPTPFELGFDWEPAVEVWVRRIRAATSGTWTVDVSLNNDLTSNIKIESEVDSPGEDFLLGTFPLHDFTDRQDLVITLNTHDITPSANLVESIFVLPARTLLTELPVSDVPGVLHDRDLWFLPSNEHGNYASWPTHLFGMAARILEDIHKRRMPMIVTRSDLRTPEIDENMQAPFFGTMPPESTSAVFHIRAVASGASQKITLKFAGQERDIPITNGGGQLWYSETFGGLDFPPGELVYGEISSTPHIDIDSFCGWFEPAA